MSSKNHAIFWKIKLAFHPVCVCVCACVPTQATSETVLVPRVCLLVSSVPFAPWCHAVHSLKWEGGWREGKAAGQSTAVPTCSLKRELTLLPLSSIFL